jgi:hypothetical protein
LDYWGVLVSEFRELLLARKLYIFLLQTRRNM